VEHEVAFDAEQLGLSKEGSGEGRLADGNPGSFTPYQAPWFASIAWGALLCAAYPLLILAPLAVFTLGLIRWTERFLGLPTLVPTGHIEIRSSDGDLPFAAFTPEVEAACRRVRRDCEFELDPIFGGKTWRAMEQSLVADQDDRGPVVYWHCGFTPEWQELGSARRAVERPV